MKNCILPLLCFISNLLPTEQSNILAVFPFNGKSHYFVYEPVVLELARRGHHVTIVTYFPKADPPENTTFVSLVIPNDTLASNVLSLDDFFTSRWLKIVGDWMILVPFAERICKGMGHENVQKLLRSNQKFDLLLVEFFITDCWASLAYHFNIPLAGMFSTHMMSWHNERFANPDNPAYVADPLAFFTSKMNFLQRTANTIVTYGNQVVHLLSWERIANKAVEKHIGSNIPPVREIVKNASIFLVNSHFSIFQPRPLVPGIIEVGGLHITPPTGNIPDDVYNYIEESPHGVVFFSLGSAVKGSTMSLNVLGIFQKVLSQIPQRVLWKWEEDEMPGKPDNVKLGKWFPQNDILAHPNVKLFMTHAGSLGVEEAVYHAVPMLMMPIFADHYFDAAFCEEKGIGLTVDIKTLTTESLSTALNELLMNNDKYRKNVQLLSKIFFDRPQENIIDTAVYWIEYVLRYNGAHHLKSAAVFLPWYQQLLLDVLCFIIFCTLFVFYILKQIFLCVFFKKSIFKVKQS